MAIMVPKKQSITSTMGDYLEAIYNIAKEKKEFMEASPRGGADWLAHFVEYRESGQLKDTCLERMKQFAHKHNAKIKEMERKNTEGEA